MDKNNNKTIYSAKPDYKTSPEEEFGFSTTAGIDRKTFIGEISTKQHAFLEISGPEEGRKRIGLEKAEVTIGRIPDCEIQLLVENVSRRHARILFRNEEYQIEDLGSKNGIYVNGIKVEKCILRKHDIIEIGGVKILFVEEEIRRDHERK
ncbi:FHA domain-containing protein [Thermodesulfobacteriota bacterium]